MAASIEEVISRYRKPSRESLLPLLQDIQDEQGYLSEESIRAVSEFLKLPVTKVFGIASFYEQLKFSSPGKFKLRVCRGTACHLQDSAWILRRLKKLLNIENGQVTRDGLFSLALVNCMGACSKAPVVSVNGEFYSVVTPADLENIIKTCRAKAI